MKTMYCFYIMTLNWEYSIHFFQNSIIYVFNFNIFDIIAFDLFVYINSSNTLGKYHIQSK